MGNVNSQDDGSGVDLGSGYSEQQWGGSDPYDVYDPTADGWVVSVADHTTEAPLPSDSKVSPVPSDPTTLRVEVVAATAVPVSLQVSTDSGLDDETVGSLTPLVRELHVGANSHALDVRVTSSTSGSAVPVQCRIYAGATLVALSTGPVAVSCSARWP